MTTNTIEVYKKIEGFSNYSVSNFGNIRNDITNKNLSTTTNRHRYLYINLSDENKKQKTKCVHLLVAQTFLKNDDIINKTEINHKDRNSKNNHVDNLEWVSHSENVKHVIKTGRKISDNRIKCEIISQDGISKIYDSQTQIAREHNMEQSLLSYIMRNKGGKFISNKDNTEYTVRFIKNDNNDIKWYNIDIEGLKHLEVSKTGKIRNKLTKRLLNGSNDGRYIRIKSDKSHKEKSFALHRIIALTFIPNPDNKPNVNHLDGNTFNNAINNLEWATQSENIKHAYNTGLVDIINKKKLIKRFIN